jgi:hypothetical protein
MPRYLTEAEANWLSASYRTAPPVMTRASFGSLSPAHQMEFSKAGVKITDDPKSVRAPLRENEMLRSTFDQMPMSKRFAAIKSGVMVVD